jgi:hypothetical protein
MVLVQLVLRLTGVAELRQPDQLEPLGLFQAATPLELEPARVLVSAQEPLQRQVRQQLHHRIRVAVLWLVVNYHKPVTPMKMGRLLSACLDWQHWLPALRLLGTRNASGPTMIQPVIRTVRQLFSDFNDLN